MSKTLPITGGAGKWQGVLLIGGCGRQALMAGTTQPGRSEDLWAQGAMVQPTSPHTVAEDQSVGGIVEGRSKRSIRPGAWLGRP